MLYRSTDCLRRRGASVEYLTHSASFHSAEKIAPSNSGTKLGAHINLDLRSHSAIIVTPIASRLFSAIATHEQDGATHQQNKNNDQ
jgi:hypothetical protein